MQTISPLEISTLTTSIQRMSRHPCIWGGQKIRRTWANPWAVKRQPRVPENGNTQTYKIKFHPHPIFHHPLHLQLDERVRVLQRSHPRRGYHILQNPTHHAQQQQPKRESIKTPNL
jgi:hypothetical protein